MMTIFPALSISMRSICTIEAKRIGILRDLVPSAVTIGVLLKPAYPDTVAQSCEIEEAARNLGLRTLNWPASTEAEIDAAFAAFESGKGWGVAGRRRPLLQ